MKTRRILSIVVAAILVVSTLAIVGLTNVFASETEISTAEQFAAITDGNYKLAADIDLTTIEFTTIASFNGTLDGNGKTITTSQPLFATANGEIKNLTVEGTITASGNLGAFVNGVYNTDALTITNCVNKASVTLESKNFVGGFVGTVTGTDNSNHASITITHSFNYGTITAGDNDGSVGAAGFIGGGKDCDVTVTDCANYGNVTQGAGDSGVAGIFGGASSWRNGKLTLTFKYTANHGTITGGNKSRAGGIAGRLDRNSGCTYTFEYCYNTAAITAGSSASGVSGYTNASAKVYAKHCYNIGALTSGGDGVYGIGIVGDSKDTRGEGNYFVGDGQIKTSKPYHVEATKLDTLEALIAELCVEGSVWEMQDGTAYPVIKRTITTTCVGDVCDICETQLTFGGEHVETKWEVTTPATVIADGLEAEICTACGEEIDTRVIPATATITPNDGVYEVYTEDQLLWLAYNMNEGKVPADATIAIKADITLTNGMTYINKTFSGTFDGENHTISGITNTIFAKLGGTFKNVTLEGSITTAEATVGVIASNTPNNGGAYVSNVVSKVDLTVASATGDNYGGFIAYALHHNVIENSVYSGTITVTETTKKAHIGGFVGYINGNDASTGLEIIDCVFDGAIVTVGNCTQLMVGGILGYNNQSGRERFVNCVNVGSITIDEATPEYYVGGIVGYLRVKEGRESLIENCIFNGTINGSGTYGAIAGILANYEGSAGVITVKNCAGINGDHALVVENQVGVITNSYAGTDAEKIGGEITLGGVTYQKYNFGYINVETSKLVTVGLTSGDKEIAGYLTTRDNNRKHDVKIVLVADLSTLDLTQTMTITFSKNGEVIKTFTASFEGEGGLEIFNAGLAAGEPYFAANGYALFGAIVKNIPDGKWDTISVTYGETEIGSANYDGPDFVYDTIPEVLAAEEGKEVVVKGTVCEIYQAWSDQYKNISFYISDAEGNRLLVFRTGTMVGIGDEVTVEGKATVYNEVIQIAQGGITVIDVVHECTTFTDADCLNPAICTVCGKANGEPNGHSYVDGTCTACGATESVGSVTASKTIKELITALGWTSSTTKQTFTLDDNVTVKINGGSNTGKAYNGDHIRIYATDSPAGTITISVPEGYELVSVKISAQTGTYAFLRVDGTTSGDICNQTVSVSGNSVKLNSVKNGSDGKQVRVTAIEVVYQPVA